MGQMMKAAVFKAVERIEIEERPVPECPEDGILVKVAACGICGGDIRNFHNGLRNGKTDQIMGHEIAGQVAACAGGVSRFQVGDRVAVGPDVSCGECYYCRRGWVNICDSHQMLGTHFPGGFAQYIALPGFVLERGFVEHIPEGMSYDFAAFAEPVSGVLACQEYNQISYGDTVVVIGDGPVGCLHMEIARARGASKVIMLARGRIDQARQFGFEHLICNKDPETATKQVKELTGPGADIVICAVPNAAAQQQALDIVRKRGRVVIYGGVPKSNPMTTLDSNKIHYDEIMVLGSFSYPSTGIADALQAIHRGDITTEKYLSARVPLKDVVEGMNMVTRGEALKVLVDPWA
ncbi:alcohol dehydrogenase catalytic domain-containing protein [Lachnospiraceae bacterium 50-23]|jgi:L-iditol 2-dehydrogenase|nr:alcohol dehydrogenase catalytic domain-containing protein [Dorea sp.]GFI36140.1 sorbitol dehydrogenase [Lachnospiraceae bacterium]